MSQTPFPEAAAAPEKAVFAPAGGSSFLLVTPFPFRGGRAYNVNVDAVISRHSGAKTKNGVFYPTGLGYVSSILKQHGHEVHLVDAVPQHVPTARILEVAQRVDAIAMPVSSTRFDDTVEILSGPSDTFQCLGSPWIQLDAHDENNE